jgi:DNA-binding beta-propeller fold protein YncE
MGQTVTFSGVQTTVGASGLNSPLGVALDGGGNLYIADSANNRVLKEIPGPGGYTQSVIADGLLAPTGLAVDSSGNVYIADTGNNRVVVETLVSGSYTQSVVASGLNGPQGVAVDASGNLYLSDTQNNRVLKEVVSSGNYTQSSIGTGFSRPEGIAVDHSGNVYVVDNGTGHLFELTPSGGSYTQKIVFAAFTSYTGLTADVNGNLYMANATNGTVLRLVPSTCNILTQSCFTVTLVGTGGLSSPWGVAADGIGDVYVGDANNNRVLEWMPAATFGQVDVGDASPAISLLFTFTSSGAIAAPSVLTKGVANLDFTDAGTGTCTTNGATHVYASGAVCSVDVVMKPRVPGSRQGAVVLSSSTGTRLATGYLNGTGVGPQVSFAPFAQSTIPYTPVVGEYVVAMAVDPAGNIFLADSVSAASSGTVLEKLTWNGNGYTQSTIDSGFTYIVQIALDGAGNIFLADEAGQTVWEESPNGSGGYTQSRPFGGLGVMSGVAVDASGNVYVSSELLGLLKYTPSGGSWSHTVIAPGEALGEVAVDSNGRIFSVSTGASYLYVPQTNGTYSQTSIGSGFGVAVDLTGNLYTQEPFHPFIWEYPAGSYTTPAVFFNGSGGGFTLDESGNLYFVQQPGAITKLDFADSPNLVFAATSVGHTSSDSPQTVTLTNAGNAPLVFEVLSAGQNPSITTNFLLNSSSGSACPLLNSSSFTTATLAAGASCQLPISYSPTTSTPAYGMLSVTDDALNAAAPSYATQQISLGVVGSQATPVISWLPPSPIVYGTPLGGAQLNASSSVPGTFTYVPAAGTIPGVGTQTLSVTLTPTDTAQYGTATATTSIVVTQAKPVLTWAPQNPITYGTALSATQLNATASVAGTFTYTPAVGTILGAGAQTLSVTFTPNDTADYSTSTATVTLTVNKATPILTWPTPAAINYGTPLSSTQLDASSPVAGTFTYTPAAGAVLNGGSNYVSVSFTPMDATDYSSTSTYIYLTVNRATPVVTWPTPAAITYGTSLTSAQLNATADVPGSFTYIPGTGNIPIAGQNTLTVYFYPYSSQNYISPITQTVSLTVNQATPKITWAPPAAITYGTALSSTQLNATASVPGTLVYTPAAGTVLATGASTLSVTFTPTDTKDYASTTQTVSLTVTKATPAITWPAPAAITYGSPITAAQLNATASVPGTFTYTPTLGAVLSAGSQPLSVTFTPADTTNYVATTSSAALIVNKAPLAISANSFARVYGAANPTFTGGVSGGVNGDTFVETFSTTATPAGIVGGYPIVPAVTGANAADYIITPTNGTLTVSQAGSNTSLALTNQNLTMTATVTSLTSGVPTGTVGFYEGQTLVGTGTISNGVATYAATSFPAGNVVVSAQYSGDADFTQSSSPPILFLDVSPANTSLSVSRGSSVTDNLSVSVVPGYSGAVQFTCTGLPAETKCTFQPASLTFSGATNTANVVVTIATNTTASISGHAFPFEPRNRVALAAVLWLPGMLIAAGWKRRRQLSARLNTLVVMLVFCCAASLLASCSGGTGGSGGSSATQTPTGAYKVQVVATGTGGLTQNADLQLTVQ